MRFKARCDDLLDVVSEERYANTELTRYPLDAASVSERPMTNVGLHERPLFAPLSHASPGH